MFSPPVGTRSPTWAVARDSVGGMSNEAMVHEMLYNPAWQLPASDLEQAWDVAKNALEQDQPLKSIPEMNLQELQAQGPAALATAMRSHVARIAEQAFWDSVEAGLQGPGQQEGEEGQHSASDRVAMLLAELGKEVVAVLPEQGQGAGLAQELGQAFSEDNLKQALSAGEGGPAAVGHLLTQTAAMLEGLGSIARRDEALEAQRSVEAQFAQALSGAPGAPTQARVTTRALRLLFAQLKLLKLDAANARLRLLSAAIAGGEALRYSSSRFRQRCGLREGDAELRAAGANAAAEKLPKTAAWIAAGTRSANDVAKGLAAAGIGAKDLAEAEAAGAVPIEMRTGRSSSAAPSSAGAGAPQAPPLAPAAADSWRGAARVGLVGLVTSEAPAAGEGLAEALELDAKRLHHCQNEMQRILVLSACMLLYQQTLGIAQRSPAPGEPESVKSRLSSILLDPALSLRDVAAELASSCGSSEDAAFSGLQRMISPSGGALKALGAGLGSALCLHLLFPKHADGGAVAAEVSNALARCGASSLKDDVKALAGELSAVAEVTEAVHGAEYSLFHEAASSSSQQQPSQ